MLLLHQVGSVKIGEVVRYTVIYTPSRDRILPSPEKLYVRIRNTSAIALRAAFVHGPYTLSVSAYPAAFDPDAKFDNPRRYGLPTFEPMLKAGGSWECELFVPDNIRQAAGTGRHGTFGNGLGHDAESSTWIIEVTSQVVFSSSAAVGYEVIVARDPKSLNLTQSLSIVGGHSQVPQPGKVSDHQQSIGAKDGHHLAQPKGVFSRAISVKVEDTATLWNTPRLPGWDDAGEERLQSRSPANRPVESVIKTQQVETDEPKPSRKRRKVHLVILTHGLHSNLGADMLFMKERIDATAKQAKLDAKARRTKERQRRQAPSPKHSDSLPGKSVSKANSGPKDKQEEDGQPMEDDDGGGDDDDAAGDEEVIVRGYSGNAKKTERGIKYLGKRLARYVLSMTYPDQPYFPLGKGTGHGYAQGTKTEKPDQDCREAHKHSSVMDADRTPRKSHYRPYRIASISFVAHSLGGLVQMYAVAYIQKHSPRFFDVIKPINFIALATPFLGLSNENPLYVKFALDFGFVGRTGQDLGLTWRAPTIARSGWGAIVSNLGESAHRKVYGETQPESKPLLRILPTGPAHTALMKFRNRTVYSNVVNDGIVPLRTSCLLFLDWQGLGRVEKARRDAGLVETVVGFGWAELTGANMVSPRHRQLSVDDHPTDSGNTTPRDNMREVPQPPSEAMGEDDKASVHSMPFAYKDDEALTASSNGTNNAGPLAGFFNLFRSSEPSKAQPLSLKQKRILRRGQTMPLDQAPPGEAGSPGSEDGGRTPKVTSGHELEDEQKAMNAPPKTTFFESAGDVLNPSMPGVEYLIDPTTRPRAIFHDRVYHPTDIPPPPLKKRHSTFSRRKPTTRNSSLSQQSASSSSNSSPSSPHPHPIQEDPPTSPVKDDEAASRSPDRMPGDAVDLSSMRVEEKIARGYHRELSWRKVLVKLEPDAHNNIFVRRMFANAYGWPVIKHMVDAHFSDSAIARMRTEDEHLGERALDMGQPPDEHGAETKPAPLPTSHDEEDAAARDAREALDEVPDLPSSKTHASAVPLPRGPPERADSVTWSEHDWIDSDNDSDIDVAAEGIAADGHGGGAQPQPQPGALSPSSWNWTEKIVGRGRPWPESEPEGRLGGQGDIAVV